MKESDLRKILFGVDDYHRIMRTILYSDLSRRAGYIPQITDTRKLKLAPIGKNYAEFADTIMQTLIGDKNVTGCNPRVPYLLFAWMLVGHDNQYRCNQYDNEAVMRHTAYLLTLIALGYKPSGQTLRKYMRLAVYSVKQQEETPNYSRKYNSLFAAHTTAFEITVLPTTLYDESSSALDVTQLVSSIVANMTNAACSALAVTMRDVQEAISNQAISWAYIDDTAAWSIASKLTMDILSRVQHPPKL